MSDWPNSGYLKGVQEAYGAERVQHEALPSPIQGLNTTSTSSEPVQIRTDSTYPIGQMYDIDSFERRYIRKKPLAYRIGRVLGRILS